MKRILIIDDDPWVLKIFAQMLEAGGYEVTTAEDGQVGYDLYKATPYDLVITDMVMPVKNGLKTIMELKTDFPNARIIAISGGGVIEPERYLSLAENVGSVKTLLKPVTKNELLAAVSEALAG